MQYRTLEDTVYFGIASNDTSGSGDDGADAVYDVRLAGAAADAIPTLSGSATLLTHANYPPGCYEIAIAATAANGFAADGIYTVYCTLAVDSQNPSGFVGSFELAAVLTNAALASVCTETRLAELDAGNLPTDIAAIPTTMVGTDDAALATTLGSAVGADISADIAAIPTTMIGTDDAALASVCTETRLAELDAGNLPTDIAAIPTVTEILGGTIEGTLTLQEATSLLVALAAGKADGGETTTIHFRNQADTKNRITLTVDTVGDRSAITTDFTDL